MHLIFCLDLVAILFQIVYRVLGHAIDNHFKVQMGAGAVASIAGQGNQLTTGNGCANTDFVSRQMGISCFYAIAMIDYNAISIAIIPASQFYSTASSRINGSACFCRQVNAGVETAASGAIRRCDFITAQRPC